MKGFGKFKSVFRYSKALNLEFFSVFRKLKHVYEVADKNSKELSELKKRAMSNTDLIIEERSRDIGDFLVGRLLPFRKKKMVGPFIFVDHMGPASLGPKKYADVDQHPHIGLSTLTYLLEGEMMHQDSIGTEQRIKPGAVNWMTAGSGVTHTERTPKDLRNGETFVMHGYQIWVALPKDLEEMTPEFAHLRAEELPVWSDEGAEFRLIAGEGFGRKSPLPVYSPMFMVELKASETYSLNIDGQVKGEIGVVIIKGGVTACDLAISEGNMLVSKSEDICNLDLEPGTHLFILGGEPFPERRYIDWNFVSHSRERIEKAKADWQAKNFPKVAGDNTYIPLPNLRKK